MKKAFLLGAVLAMSSLSLYAQDSNYVMRHIKLDSFVVTASQYGFDVAGFIERVEHDTTFYKAFKSLRILSYNARNNIRVFNKRGKVKASLESFTKQHRQGDCRTMEVINEKTSGNFYKKDSQYNYYTAELYASLFFTEGRVCGETNLIDEQGDINKSHGALERHKEQLKQLIFNPGQRIRGVPFIGRKVAVFDDKIAPMYDFSIHSEILDSADCYVFTVKAKPEFKDKVVINNLVTYFSKKNMEIVHRDYALSYNNLAFDFNVEMHVSMTHFDGIMIPKKIAYKGDWKILFKKRENAVFYAVFDHFSHQG